jgi:hypothetical protein
MTEQQAEQCARAFVEANYPEWSDWRLEVTPDGDDGGWSFGVHEDHEEGDRSFTGYVRPDGSVEGLY